MRKSIPQGGTMPEPLPEINRDHQCYNYQAPTGQRCGSPALKGEYYCYHHLVRIANRKNHRVLIDPEVTCMEIPPIEDRTSIFNALAAVVHRLAENTIDTRRAGQMIYGLQVAMRALEPPPAHRCRTTAPQEPAVAQPATDDEQPATSSSGDSPAPPKTIAITKESLLYFLRSRHCYQCNAELFPPEELTFRRNAGAKPEVIEEARAALPSPEAVILSEAPSLEGAQSKDREALHPAPTDRTFQPQPENQHSATGTLPTIQAVAQESDSVCQPEHRMRDVRLFQRLDFLRRQLQRDCRDRVFQVVQLGRAHDRRRDRGLGEHPHQRQRGLRNAARPGDLAQAVYHALVCFLRARVEVLAEAVALRARGLLCSPGARQPPARQRAPWDDA